MDSENTGGGSQTATRKSKAPYLIFGIVIVIALAALAFYATQAPAPSNTTTSIISWQPPNELFFIGLTLPSNALYGLSASPFIEYFNYTTGTSGQAQYAYNFTYPLFAPVASIPSNYSIHVPPQYANLTSPFAVVVVVWRNASNSDAAIQYGSRSRALCSEVNSSQTLRTTTSGFGSSSTYCNGVYYGGQVEATAFLSGNYTVDVAVFGVLNKLGTSYLNATASHVYGIVSQQPV